MVWWSHNNNKDKDKKPKMATAKRSKYYWKDGTIKGRPHRWVHGQVRCWMSDGWMQAAGGVEVEQLFKFGASLWHTELLSYWQSRYVYVGSPVLILWYAMDYSLSSITMSMQNLIAFQLDRYYNTNRKTNFAFSSFSLVNPIKIFAKSKTN